MTQVSVQLWGDILLDFSGKTSLAKRFRALFALRNTVCEESINLIVQAFKDNSALLKHEVAYVLGQMQQKIAIPFLIQVLENTAEHEMVRHEAAEALGALGCPSSIPFLQKYLNDPSKSVAETCEISIDRINDLSNIEKNGPNKMGIIFGSVDPAPAEETTHSVQDLEKIYLDLSKSLYLRYKALFGLRNISSEESTVAICKGFSDPSALFRHEVAYVLGQLQQPVSASYLMKVLENSEENPMVRHECAEALGSIASEECMEYLKNYLNDKADVVRESCEVALDIAEYENDETMAYF
jgi:deoxyhypusine monooxygenase